MSDPRIQAVITADDKASKVISGVGKSFSDFSKKAGLAMVAVGAGLTVVAKKSVDYTTDLVKSTKQLSRETGISERESSKLLFVTNRLGIGADEVSTTFGIFSKRIAESAKSTNKQEDAFDKLGVSVKDATGKILPFNDVLLATADKFKNMEDGPKKTALAMELFGRSGKSMIKILNLGSQGIQDLQEQATKLGLVLSKDNIASISRYIQSQKSLSDSTNALKMQIGLLTAPVLTSFNMKLNEVVTRLISTGGVMRNAVLGIAAFGGPVLTATGALTGFIGNLVTAAPALARVGALLGSVGAFLTGPWGAALMVAIGIGGLFVSNLFNQTNATMNLKKAEADLASAREAQKAAKLAARDADLRLKEARLGVTRATNDVRTAESTYGKKSLEYKEAALRKKRAENELADAKNASKQASKDVKRAEEEVSSKAHTKRFVESQAQKASSLGTLSAQAQETTNRLNEVKAAGDGAAKTQGGKSTKFVDALTGKKAKATGTDFFTPRKYATGTGSAYGGMALVGERGPEMVTLPRGSKVSRADETRRMMGGSSIINISINAGAYLGSQQEARKHAKVIYQALVEMAGMKGQTLQQLIAGGR